MGETNGRTDRGQKVWREREREREREAEREEKKERERRKRRMSWCFKVRDEEKGHSLRPMKLFACPSSQLELRFIRIHKHIPCEKNHRVLCYRRSARLPGRPSQSVLETMVITMVIREDWRAKR